MLGAFVNLYAFGTHHRLGPLNTIQQLDEWRFLDLLNEPQASPNPVPSMSLFPQFLSPPRVSAILREWVDEWIDSARDSDGVEKPAERKFREDGKIEQVVYDYSQRNRICLFAKSQGLELWFKRYEVTDGRPRLLGVRNEDIARENLVFLLLSDLRFKLAKCRRDGCGKYFALNHWKRTYKRGTFCSECQRARSQESAVRATAGERNEAEWMLSRLAARKFAKRIAANPNWHQDANLRTALVKYLNARIERVDLLRSVYKSGNRNGITTKWLSHAKNWNAIQMFVKGEI